MKKLSYMVLLLLVALCAVSCSNDEPNHNNNKPTIKRPQDGDGKVFVENGKLVEANMNFTKEQLKEALENYDWKREYSFYYDNNTVSGKENIYAMPTYIHANGYMDYYDERDGWISTRTIDIKEKILIASQMPDPMSSSFYIADEFIVVSLDMADGDGRMVLDYKLHKEVTGYDINSSYVRMVWRMVPSE